MISLLTLREYCAVSTTAFWRLDHENEPRLGVGRRLYASWQHEDGCGKGYSPRASEWSNKCKWFASGNLEAGVLATLAAFVFACRISWRGPVVLVPGTFCLWFQFFRGGCCSRRGNPCSCRRGNIWIWWINNMNYISKIHFITVEVSPSAGGWSWHLKLAENHEDQKSSKELTGRWRSPWKWGGSVQEKMSLLMCWKTLLLQVTTVTTCKHPPKTEPLPFITTILNPWILRSWWWSCWGLWRYGGETSARVEIQHLWHSTPRQLEETRRLHRELVSEAFRQTKARCWCWGQLKESSGSSD